MGLLILAKPVGKNCPNLPQDVRAVSHRLMDIGKIPRGAPITAFDQRILKGIADVQRHWMQVPDGVISLGGKTQGFLGTWKEKDISPGVQLPGRLREA